MILLDTNVLSELMKPSPDAIVLSWLDEKYQLDLFISAITRAEINLGIALLPEGKRKTQLFEAAEDVFAMFGDRCLSFGEAEACRYAQVVAGRTLLGRPISVEDAQIAAITLEHGLMLATRNVKDFAGIKGLQILNPWELMRG